MVEKLGIRSEGIAERLIEIDGVWEDHMRFAITVEEWAQRRKDLKGRTRRGGWVRSGR